MENILDRRRVLRGLLGTGGAVAIPLPALNIMLNGNGTALAATGDPLPVRFVLWFFGNGMLPSTWRPAAMGSGDAWALTPQLAPLANVKDSLNVLTGLSPTWLADNNHQGPSSAATTGSYFTGASIDQIVADSIGKTTPFRSLEIGVSRGVSNTAPGGVSSGYPIARRANYSPLIPEFDPPALYKRLIGVAPTNTVDIRALTQARGGAFDAVMKDAASLRAQVGVEDQRRLDGHLEGLRTLASRVAALPPLTPTPKPGVPVVRLDMKAEAPPELNAVMAELAVFALAAGQTNVIAFTFTTPAGHVWFRNLGPDMNDDFHALCHEDPGTDGNQPRVLKGVVYTMQCFAALLEKMKAMPDGASNLLDNSLVYATSCTAWGKIHGMYEYPALLVGRAGGRVRTNQHLRFPKENLTSVLLTAANAMGLGLSQFGVGNGVSSTMLPGILA